MEFKRKDAPQIDENRDDVAQAIHYKEYLQNHHAVTRDKNMEVKSYLVCTGNAASSQLRGIDILTKDNFCSVIEEDLEEAKCCSFSEVWLDSSRTEMPDMLQAIGQMYNDGEIPYISEVNQNCLEKVSGYISDARKNKMKILILINGVPGAGKTAVGQSIVFEENQNGEANAVYLSGNGPLVEVLQYQIDRVGDNRHIGENDIQSMKNFKRYFNENTQLPKDLSIIVFDEAQRAWSEEPEGLLSVCDRICRNKGYAVLIGLYGNGQVIYKGEEAGLSSWEALKEHQDWTVIASPSIANQLNKIGDTEKCVDEDMFLSTSIRADFVDCSNWVEQVIGRNNATLQQAQNELEALYNTSMRICVTRSFDAVRTYIRDEIEANHPKWKYGLMASNFAGSYIIRNAIGATDVGFNKTKKPPYGWWFVDDGCKELNTYCSVFGNQGLELDCPIVVFGGEYVRQDGEWKTNIPDYILRKRIYNDPDTIVENNFRVLLTRARKELILLIPEEPDLDETYRYFRDMGMDEL